MNVILLVKWKSGKEYCQMEVCVCVVCVYIKQLLELISLRWRWRWRENNIFLFEIIILDNTDIYLTI